MHIRGRGRERGGNVTLRLNQWSTVALLILLKRGGSALLCFADCFSRAAWGLDISGRGRLLGGGDGCCCRFFALPGQRWTIGGYSWRRRWTLAVPEGRRSVERLESGYWSWPWSIFRCQVTEWGYSGPWTATKRRHY
ncbi:hypothetical protein F5882DRAFT_394373 [Hyaloscypha sp. PMI_1271]|nr:hypothetical protein F5882DRAFT_394373 [Hyaloscypha sp. PMI_1271]